MHVKFLKSNLRLIVSLIFFLQFLICNLFSAFEERELFARPAGLGGAYVAEYGESGCIYYNPAGLINLPKFDFLFSYTKPYNIEVLSDLTASFSTEVKSLGKVGFLWNSFGYDLYKEDRMYFAYSKNLTSNFSIGANLKSNSVTIKDFGSKSLFGLDVGFLGVLNPSVVVGMVVKNVNSPELTLTEKLPLETIAGVRLEYIANSPSYIDFVKPSLESVYFRFGQEIFFNKVLSFRLGVETVTKDKPAKYSFGFSVKYKSIILDYANIVHPYLGSQMLFSLGIRFGEKVSLGEIVYEEKVRPGTRRRRTTKKEYTGPKLDLNKATVEQLDELPGVGPSLAQKIVEVREMLGGYKSVDDLEEVPRMGKITLERIKQYVYVGEVTGVKQDTEKRPTVIRPKSRVRPRVIEEEEEEIVEYEEVPQKSKLKENIVDLQSPVVISEPKVVKPTEVKEKVETVEKPKEVPEQQKSLTEEKKLEKIDQPVKKEETKQEVVKKYNINKITEQEFKTLGFSDTDAKNIVRYRTKFGNFKSVEELNKVPNINKKLIEKIKDNLSIED